MNNPIGPPPPRLGVYVHIPFCGHKCPYCDFNAGTAGQALRQRYLEALEAEIDASIFTGSQVTSLFIGGGTPSELTPSQIRSLLETLRQNFRITPDCEFTLECNPETAGREFLQELIDLGVNRLSLGAQSFQDDQLRILGRSHRSEDTRRAYRTAREVGFDNINLDLLFGLPRQTRESWRQSLSQALSMGPEHLSLYQLTVHQETEWGRLQGIGELQIADRDTISHRYDMGRELTASCGYIQYDVCHFAQPEKESRQNHIYSCGLPYLGLGVGAASFIDGNRWTNSGDWDSYLEGAAAGRVPEASRECLSDAELLEEEIGLRLKTVDGISLPDLSRRYARDVSLIYADTLCFLQEQGLLLRQGDRVTLTPQAWGAADAVAAQFSRTKPAGASLPSAGA